MTVSAVSWFWEFGDGVTSHDKNPYHIYAMPGTYTVHEQVTDSAGVVYNVYHDVNVYDSNYSGEVPNVSLLTKCYRLPSRVGEGYGVSEYKDNDNPGHDWVWPQAQNGTAKGYDIYKREIALVLDSKTQREFRINDEDCWHDREGQYEPINIKSEIHQKAYTSNQGEHVPIRHVEHHICLKSFDRLNMQGASGYNKQGLPSDFVVDNQLFADEEAFTPIVTAKHVQPDGDLVFQEKVEATNLQLRTVIHSAPWLLNQVIPYFETIDKQQRPSLRVMTEDGYQQHVSSMPLFHVSRNYDPLLNYATGEHVTGTYSLLTKGPDNRDSSALYFGAGATGLSDTLPDALDGDFTCYLWVKDIQLMPIQKTLFQTGVFRAWIDSTTFPILAFRFTDGTHNFTCNLSTNGNAWTLITLVRDGTSLKVYEGKNLVSTFSLTSVIDYGTAYQTARGVFSIFDSCVLPDVMEAADIEYYHDDVLNGGEQVLQPF
jgi:hypothetical protein